MRKLLIISTAISILLIICTFDDFLSLHDIKRDYVSKSVLKYLQVDTSAPLPPWTDTRLEWTSFTISYIVRLVLILVNLVILFLATRRLSHKNGIHSAETSPAGGAS
jgi:hypothetical protein